MTTNPEGLGLLTAMDNHISLFDKNSIIGRGIGLYPGMVNKTSQESLLAAGNIGFSSEFKTIY